jgi:hypothetical protein
VAAPDVLIVVAPSLDGNSKALRDMAQRFFQDRLGNKGRFQIDANIGDRTVNTISPKCFGLDMNSNGQLTHAFILVQEGEAQLVWTSLSLGHPG